MRLDKKFFFGKNVNSQWRMQFQLELARLSIRISRERVKKSFKILMVFWGLLDTCFCLFSEVNDHSGLSFVFRVFVDHFWIFIAINLQSIFAWRFATRKLLEFVSCFLPASDLVAKVVQSSIQWQVIHRPASMISTIHRWNCQPWKTSRAGHFLIRSSGCARYLSKIEGVLLHLAMCASK